MVDEIAEFFRVRHSLLADILRDRAFLESVSVLARETVKVLKQGGKVLFCGNGGSFADCLHICAELTGRYMREGRKPLPGIVLGANYSSLTAISNDYSYEEVFVRELKGIACSGDMLWGLSTSGKSRNVLLAMEEGRRRNLVCVGLSRAADTPLKNLSDIYVGVPSESTPLIQEIHKMVGHIVCEYIDREF